MAGRFTNGQKVRVPDSLASDPTRAFSDYAGKIGVATGETGEYHTDHDRADFGPLGVGLFAEGELELVTFSVGDTVRVTGNDSAPRHSLKVGSIGKVVALTPLSGVPKVRGERESGPRGVGNQWVAPYSLELVHTPGMVNVNAGDAPGLTRGDRVVFTEDDWWGDLSVRKGDRATYYGLRFAGDAAAVLLLDDGTVFLAWQNRIRPWDGKPVDSDPTEEGDGSGRREGRPGEPNWAQVEAGDRVTFTNSLGETVGPVTATGGTDPDDIFVLGRRTTQWGAYGTLNLIEKPAPDLPTTPGSVIRGEAEGVPALTAMLTEDRGWVDHEGDERHPHGWVWALVYDAGADQ